MSFAKQNEIQSLGKAMYETAVQRNVRVSDIYSCKIYKTRRIAYRLTITRSKQNKTKSAELELEKHELKQKKGRKTRPTKP